nr:MAG: hypothetical protein [Microvirus sp.]
MFFFLKVKKVKKKQLYCLEGFSRTFVKLCQRKKKYKHKKPNNEKIQLAWLRYRSLKSRY